MGAKDHFAGSEGDAVIGVGCAVIKKLVDFLVGACCGCCLFGAYVTKRVEELVVYCSGVVKQGPNDSLDAFDTVIVKEVAGVFIWSELSFGTEVDGCCFGWGELSFLGDGMIILEEDCCDVFIHGEATGSFLVVPDEVDSGVEIAIPVFGEIVVLLDGVPKVDGMLFANVFNPEVVHYEGEHDGSPFVTPEAGSGIQLVVACFVETFLEKLVGQNSGLGKSVNASDDLEVDPTVPDMVGEVVFIDELLRDVV